MSPNEDKKLNVIVEDLEMKETLSNNVIVKEKPNDHVTDTSRVKKKKVKKKKIRSGTTDNPIPNKLKSNIVIKIIKIKKILNRLKSNPRQLRRS